MRAIDVFVKVIDNYGDIGFVLEVIDAWKQRFPMDTFQIYTNHPELFESFLRRMNKTGITIRDEKSFDNTIFSGIGWFFFKYPIPSMLLSQEKWIQGKGIFFDYLSFHPDAVKMQGKEHIQSTTHFPIHTMVNSPLLQGGGTIFPVSTHTSKDEWCSYLWLEKSVSEKLWITVFCYPEMWEFIKNQIPPDFLVWHLEEREAIAQQGNVISLPFQSFENYQKLLGCSDINIVRWEVSLVRAIHAWKPFLWDMYKWIGGWNEEEFEYFIEWMDDEYTCPDEYENISRNLNTRTWEILFSHLIDWWKAPIAPIGKDIIETIHSYIA